MEREKISVIVTLYNRLEYARNIIQSLLHQTLMIDELIFADDGSKDDVVDVISDLIERCPFSIKHVYQEDIGFRLARSRNNGARVATGEFLIFLDQDVILPDDFVEKVYEKRRKKRIVFSKAYLTLEKQKIEIQKIIDTNYNFNKIYDVIYTKEDNKNFMKQVRRDVINNFLYKLKLRKRGAKIAGLMFALYKEDYINIDGFDENYIGWGEEDDDFCNRFFKYGGTTQPVILKKCLIHMYHPFATSKAESPNEEYYQRRKKEITKLNYKSVIGYSSEKNKEEIKIKELN